MKLSKNIKEAIKSGPIPKIRDWRNIDFEKLTRGEKVCMFIETYCKVPEGKYVGESIKLALFQEAFILAIYDNPDKTRNAYLSIARKNGKSALISAILACHIIGPEARNNSQIISGALSKEQAALVYNLTIKMINRNPDLDGLYKNIDSQKKMIGLAKNVEYKATAADGARIMGISPVLAILDEVGQIVGSTNLYTEAITSSQGAHDNPLLIAISTSSAGDSDLFQMWINDAEVSSDKHTVCHVYKADEECELLDKKQIEKANPAIEAGFRSEERHYRAA